MYFPHLRSQHNIRVAHSRNFCQQIQFFMHYEFKHQIQLNCELTVSPDFVITMEKKLKILMPVAVQHNKL